VRLLGVSSMTYCSSSSWLSPVNSEVVAFEAVRFLEVLVDFLAEFGVEPPEERDSLRIFWKC